MNELNEIEKKILDLYNSAKNRNEALHMVSKFFLEEIKEAWIRSYDSKKFDPEGIISSERFDDYLKSKYKI